MFQDLDVTQFVWLNALSQTEVYGFDDFNREEAIFTESFYSGKEFLNEIKKNYLVLNLKIGAFKDASTFYEICDEMDIEACVVTVTEEDGSESSYNEVVLDGELYILNATEDGGVLEKYTPEEIN